MLQCTESDFKKATSVNSEKLKPLINIVKIGFSLENCQIALKILKIKHIAVYEPKNQIVKRFFYLFH